MKTCLDNLDDFDIHVMILALLEYKESLECQPQEESTTKLLDTTRSLINWLEEA